VGAPGKITVDRETEGEGRKKESRREGRTEPNNQIVF